MNTTVTLQTPEFQTFLTGVNNLVSSRTSGNLNFSVEARETRKYIRIDNTGHGSGVYCFVDRETGDVLKPATWAAPAKHARGNIFDSSNGLAHMGPFGPAYLKVGRKGKQVLGG